MPGDFARDLWRGNEFLAGKRNTQIEIIIYSKFCRQLGTVGAQCVWEWSGNETKNVGVD